MKRVKNEKNKSKNNFKDKKGFDSIKDIHDLICNNIPVGGTPTAVNYNIKKLKEKDFFDSFSSKGGS